VSDEVRARVEAAMHRLDYRRHGAAARLSTGTSGLVAAVLPDVLNPFWTAVLAGAEQRLADLGSSLVVTSAGHDVGGFEKAVRRLEQYGIDGAIVATAPSARHLDICRDTSLAVVVTGADGRSRGVPSVCVDDRAGMRLITDHLLDHGHERLALVNGPRQRVWCGRRRRGVVDGLVARGFAPDEALHEVVVDRMDVDHGRAAAARVAELYAEAGVTAVACANDLLAIGLAGELLMHGIQVPTHLSITGFDDIAAARWTSPGLSTVRQDPVSIGETAAELLLGTRERTHVVVQHELVIRSSVAAR
jgi:LacI family transcriptional regulator